MSSSDSSDYSDAEDGLEALSDGGNEPVGQSAAAAAAGSGGKTAAPGGGSSSDSGDSDDVSDVEDFLDDGVGGGGADAGNAKALSGSDSDSDSSDESIVDDFLDEGDAPSKSEDVGGTHTPGGSDDGDDGAHGVLKEDYFVVLQNVFDEAELTPAHQQDFLDNLEESTYADGEFIVRQGDMGDRFFIVVSGTVKVTENGKDGAEDRVLTRLYKGAHFGEYCLVREQPRLANIVADGTVVCKHLAKSAFQALVAVEPNFKNVITGLVERVERTRAKRAEVKPSARRATISFVQSRTATKMSKQLYRFKNEDKQEVINGYVVVKKLGEGAYGMVYMAEKDGGLFALKAVDKKRVRRKRLGITDAEILREVEVMKKLQHENIVGLLEVIDDKATDKLYLVQEYVELGPIMTEEEYNQPLPMDLARQYFRHILKGCEYLHFQRVIHRDLKPSNILINGQGVAKIADFGVSTITTEDSLTEVQGTPAFMAPELFEEGAYEGAPADMYALGATLYCLVVGKPPFMAPNEFLLVKKLKSEEPSYPPTLDPHLRHLLGRLLAKSPSERITVFGAMEHEWVTQEGVYPLPRSIYVRVDVSVKRQAANLRRRPTRHQVARAASRHSIASATSSSRGFGRHQSGTLQHTVSFMGAETVARASGEEAQEMSDFHSDEELDEGALGDLRRTKSEGYLLSQTPEITFLMELGMTPRKRRASVASSGSFGASATSPSPLPPRRHTATDEGAVARAVEGLASLAISSDGGAKGAAPLRISSTAAPSASAPSLPTPGLRKSNTFSVDALDADHGHPLRSPARSHASSAASPSDTVKTPSPTKARGDASSPAESGGTGHALGRSRSKHSLKGTGPSGEEGGHVGHHHRHRGHQGTGLPPTMDSGSKRASMRSILAGRAESKRHLHRGKSRRQSTRAAAAAVHDHLQALRRRQLNLLTGHANLSAEDIDGLLEQQRMAFHSKRADVEVIDLSGDGSGGEEGAFAGRDAPHAAAGGDASRAPGAAGGAGGVAGPPGSGVTLQGLSVGIAALIKGIGRDMRDAPELSSTGSYEASTTLASDSYDGSEESTGRRHSGVSSDGSVGSGAAHTRARDLRAESLGDDIIPVSSPAGRSTASDSDAQSSPAMPGGRAGLSAIMSRRNSTGAVPSLNQTHSRASLSRTRSEIDPHAASGGESDGLRRTSDFVMVTKSFGKSESGAPVKKAVIFRAADSGKFSIASHSSASQAKLKKIETDRKGDNLTLHLKQGELETLGEAGSSSESDLSDTEVFDDVTDRLGDVLDDLIDAPVAADPDLEPLSDIDDPDADVSDYSSTTSSSSSRASSAGSFNDDDAALQPTGTEWSLGDSVHPIDVSGVGLDGTGIHIDGLTKRRPSFLNQVACEMDSHNIAAELRYGASEEQGKRSTMEDRTMVLIDLNSALELPEGSDPQAFFGVYDGHDGDSTAIHLSRRLHYAIAESVHFSSDVSAALVDGFLRTDAECMEEEHFCGATAATMLVRRTETGTMLHVAHVGDCRIVLSTAGIANDLTKDHKPESEDEKRRIEEAGGWVSKGRLHGVLAVARAFGDVEHKKLKEQCWEKEFKSDPLIARPDVRTERLSEADEFAIIACDGLWDVMSSQQAVNFVRKRLKEHGDVQLASSELVQKALERSTVDNTSAVVVCFHQEAGSAGGAGGGQRASRESDAATTPSVTRLRSVGSPGRQGLPVSCTAVRAALVACSITEKNH